jgi:hypothetical protein
MGWAPTLTRERTDVTTTGGSQMKRWPLFAAIAYVVLLFAGLVAVPAAPDVSESGARLVRYYQDHGDGVRFAVWCGAWSTVPIVLLIATSGLVSRARRGM